MANGNANVMSVSQRTLENSGSTQDLLQFISNASRQIKSVLRTVETTQPLEDVPHQVNLSSPVPSPTPSMSSTGSYEPDLLSLEPPRYLKNPPPYEFIQSHNNTRKRRHIEIGNTINQNKTTKKRIRQNVEASTRIMNNGDVYQTDTIMRDLYRSQGTPLSQHQLLGMLTNTNSEFLQHNVQANSKICNSTIRTSGTMMYTSNTQLGSQGNLYQPQSQNSDAWCNISATRPQSQLYEIQHEQQQQHLYRNMNQHLKQLQQQQYQLHMQQEQQKYFIDQQNQFHLLQQQQQLLLEEQKLQQQQLHLRKQNSIKNDQQQQQKYRQEQQQKLRPEQQTSYVSNPEIVDLLSFIEGEEVLTDDTIADFLLSDKISL